MHYNEDFTAIHAPTLLDQAEYLVSIIPRVLAEYRHLPTHQRPSTVTILGHSMGGVVARLAIRLAELPVDAIVTIATPHQLPPANLELGMERLYAKVNTPPGVVDPILISICGGIADTQIVSDSCALPNFIGPDDGFAVFSSGMPATWTNVEHQAIVWCDQVRWRVARILLDMNAVATRAAKLSVARRWLRGTLPLSAESKNATAVVKRLEGLNVHDDMTYIVRLHNPTPTQIADPPFQLSCDSSTCKQTPTVQVIPFPDDARLPFPLPGEGVRNAESAFAINLKNVSGTVAIGSSENFDVLTVGAHLEIEAASGKWISTFCAGYQLTTGSVTPKASHLSFHFSTLVSSLLAYRLQLITRTCIGKSPDSSALTLGRPPVIHFRGHSLDDVNEESRFYLGTNSSVTLHSHISGAPFQGRQQHSYGLSVDIYQQPSCVVDHLRLNIDILASVAKISLRLRVAAVVWAIGWSATILYRQLSTFSATGEPWPLQHLTDRCSA